MKGELAQDRCLVTYVQCIVDDVIGVMTCCKSDLIGCGLWGVAL